MITEQQLEQICLDWFQELGYQYQPGTELGPDTTPFADIQLAERDNHTQVVLKARLLKSLIKLNKGVPTEALAQVAEQISSPETPVLVTNNRIFHRYLIEGFPLEYQYEEQGQSKVQHTHVQLIDFEHPQNNAFLVTNQFTIVGTKGNRRPDVIVFINGLPIAVLELKNPADEHTDIWHAYNQLQTYKDEISDLFAFNEAMVISDGWLARVGSLTADTERYMPWKTLGSEDDKPQHEYQLETLVKGFFRPDLLLDYIRYFVLFETNKEQVIKKIAGYHQFHAVRAAVRATVVAATTDDRIKDSRASYAEKVVPGSKKAGVIWHTQGSGKSISMVCYASKLLQQPSLNNPTIVVVTDRNDLDSQLFNTFDMAHEVLKQVPQQAEDRQDLRDLLVNRQSGGIIFTTIQKFALLEGETEHPKLSERANIMVISDEAHRSQYGEKARLVEVKNQHGEVTGHKYVYGYSKYMREALPLASFIGFTGTPIALEDKDTRAVFGDYVSIYDIQDAVDDGATVPIYYESRLAKLDIKRAEIEKLNQQVDFEIGEDEETEVREKLKSHWASLEKLVGSEPRINLVAEDLVSHFTQRDARIPGKAMIVAMSRDICVDLYNAITALKPEWHSDELDRGVIKIIMTGSASDKEKLQPHLYDNRAKKRIEKRFKDPDDPLKLVIVRDMWLTGFDAPCCHTMYVDKPMRGHNLMQAIARVNRVFKDKPGGLVVDYIGIANELKAALQTYKNSQGHGDPTVDTDVAYGHFRENLQIVRDMFTTPVDGTTFDYLEGFEARPMALMPGALNHLSGLSTNGNTLDGKQRFLEVMSSLNKAYSLCSTLDEVNDYKNEVAFYSAIKAAFVKELNVDRKRLDEYRNSALKQILDNAIVTDGVDDLYSLVGLEKPNISLLSDEFLEDVKHLKQQNLAVELLSSLMRKEVSSYFKHDVVQEQKYSERILATLNKYHNRNIATAQVIEELIQWAREMQQDAEMLDQLNLSADEMAFYHALVENESAVKEMSNDTLRKLAIELTQQLRRSATVDWQKRDSVRARMRNLVRRLLRRYKYPPERCDKAIKLVLQQAEKLSDKWSSTPTPVRTVKPVQIGDHHIYLSTDLQGMDNKLNIAQLNVTTTTEFVADLSVPGLGANYSRLYSSGIINLDILAAYFHLEQEIRQGFKQFEIREYDHKHPELGGVIVSLTQVTEGSSKIDVALSYITPITDVFGAIDSTAGVISLCISAGLFIQNRIAKKKTEKEAVVKTEEGRIDIITDFSWKDELEQHRQDKPH